MVEPINLNKFRKAKARAEKEQRAAENRAKFGRTKAEKAADEARDKKLKQDVDSAKLDED